MKLKISTGQATPWSERPELSVKGMQLSQVINSHKRRRPSLGVFRIRLTQYLDRSTARSLDHRMYAHTPPERRGFLITLDRNSMEQNGVYGFAGVEGASGMQVRRLLSELACGALIFVR